MAVADAFTVVPFPDYRLGKSRVHFFSAGALGMMANAPGDAGTKTHGALSQEDYQPVSLGELGQP